MRFLNVCLPYEYEIGLWMKSGGSIHYEPTFVQQARKLQDTQAEKLKSPRDFQLIFGTISGTLQQKLENFLYSEGRANHNKDT